MNSHEEKKNLGNKPNNSINEDSLKMRVVYTSTELIEAAHRIMKGIQDSNAKQATKAQ